MEWHLFRGAPINRRPSFGRVEENEMNIRRMSKTVALATMLLTIASAVFAADAKPEIVVTYAQASGAFTPIWVAFEAGLYKKHGLNAKVQLMNPQLSAQAVISGDADFYTDGPDLINARMRGGEVKYFGGTIQQLVFQMFGAKDVTSIQQLKGKAVAAST